MHSASTPRYWTRRHGLLSSSSFGLVDRRQPNTMALMLVSTTPSLEEVRLYGLATEFHRPPQGTTTGRTSYSEHPLDNLPS